MGSKPIHIASRDGFKDVVEYFLSKGSSINDLGFSNQTLLHYAVINNHPDIAKFLIEKGAIVNAKDADGVSPLHLAANCGNMDTIKILLKYDAAYNAADNLGRIPLEVATKLDVLDYLNSIKGFFGAVKSNNIPEVKRYIKAGMILDVKNCDGATPMHFSAWKGYEEIINILLQNNADPNTTNNKGNTSLHYAVKNSHLKIVQTLLSYGAIFNAVSNSGKTPLDFSTNKSISNLLKLVNDSFESVRSGDFKIISTLNKIKDVATIKAVMRTCNDENKTLIVVAIQCNFPKVNALKDILQEDVPETVIVALMSEEHGDFQNALYIFSKIYEKRRNILGQDNPGTFEIERHIARILYRQGNYNEALSRLERIYQKQKDMLGINHKDTLNTRSDFALILHRQGRHGEAFEIFQEVCKMQKEIIGPNHPDSIDTQFHMASVLGKLGQHEEALAIYRRIYEERKHTLGINNPHTIAAQNNIAYVLSNQGKYEQSLKIYRAVLKKKKSVLGLYHADTLRTLQNIATILGNQKKYNEALEALQEVLSIQKVILGPNNPDTLKTQHNLGTFFYAAGNFINAFKVFTECFQEIKSSFGSTSEIVTDISQKLETLKLLHLGEYETNLLHVQDDIKTAIMNGDEVMVLRLLKEGTDVNEKDGDGITLLHFAVNCEHVNIVRILLKNGASVFQISDKGYTPLHLAATKNSEIVQVLLQHVQQDKLNDFVNAKTTSGKTTALHVAAESGFLCIVKLLLEYGAIYNIEDNNGNKPQNLARDQRITNFLESIDELFDDATNGNEKIIKKLKVMKKYDFSTVTKTRNNQGNTFLQVAIIEKHVKIAQKLVEMLKNK